MAASRRAFRSSPSFRVRIKGMRRRGASGGGRRQAPRSGRNLRGARRALDVPADGPTRDFAHHAARATATPTDINTEAPAARTSAASDLRRYPSLAVVIEPAPERPSSANRFILRRRRRHKTNSLTDCAEGSAGLPTAMAQAGPGHGSQPRLGLSSCAIPGSQITQWSSRRGSFRCRPRPRAPNRGGGRSRNSLRPRRRLDTHDQTPRGAKRRPRRP